MLFQMCSVYAALTFCLIIQYLLPGLWACIFRFFLSIGLWEKKIIHLVGKSCQCFIRELTCSSRLKSLKMDALSVVTQLRNLASDPLNRTSIVRDKSCISGLILFINHQDTSVVQCALQTIHYLCGNPNHCEIMKNEFGMMTSLENIRSSCNISSTIKQLAQAIYVLLSAPLQLFTPETKSKRNKPQFFISSTNKRAKTITLHIHGLDDLERKYLCEEALLKVKGVISFTFQTASRRCTIRVKPDLATDNVTSAIADTKVLKAQQVIRNESGDEVYLPLQSLEQSPVLEKKLCLPDYLPEEESPQKGLEKAVTRPVSKEECNGSWFNTAANFLSKTFYW